MGRPAAKVEHSLTRMGWAELGRNAALGADGTVGTVGANASWKSRPGRGRGVRCVLRTRGHDGTAGSRRWSNGATSGSDEPFRPDGPAGHAHGHARHAHAHADGPAPSRTAIFTTAASNGTASLGREAGSTLTQAIPARNVSNWRSRPVDAAGGKGNAQDAAMFLSRSEVTYSTKRRGEGTEAGTAGSSYAAIMMTPEKAQGNQEVEATATCAVPALAGQAIAQTSIEVAEADEEEEEVENCAAHDDAAEDEHGAAEENKPEESESDEPQGAEDQEQEDEEEEEEAEEAEDIEPEEAQYHEKEEDDHDEPEEPEGDKLQEAADDQEEAEDNEPEEEEQEEQNPQEQEEAENDAEEDEVDQPEEAEDREKADEAAVTEENEAKEDPIELEDDTKDRAQGFRM